MEICEIGEVEGMTVAELEQRGRWLEEKRARGLEAEMWEGASKGVVKFQER